MLTIVVPGIEMFDEAKGEFTSEGDFILELEHSLVSLSKWESVYEKSFLSNKEKTAEELLVYIRAMVLNPEVPPQVFNRLSNANLEEINQYINRRMSATWFPETPNRPGQSESVTSELIYYWMIAYNIPLVCETWHLNRLFTLIRVCSLKSSVGKTKNKRQLASDYARINAERKARLGTTG